MAVIANAKARVILLNIVILLVLKPRAGLRGLDRRARDLFPSLHSNEMRGSDLHRAAAAQLFSTRSYLNAQLFSRSSSSLGAALLKESHCNALSGIPISITLS
jgi:hypothetical protein